MLYILLSLWCFQASSVTFLFTQSGPYGENGHGYFVKPGGMICKLMDYATYSLFSRLIISILTKRLVFENPRVSHAHAITSRYVLLRKGKYGRSKCTRRTVVRELRVKGPRCQRGTSRKYIFPCAPSLPPTQSDSGAGPCRMYFNMPRMWAPDLVFKNICTRWWILIKAKQAQDYSRWEVCTWDCNLFSLCGHLLQITTTDEAWDTPHICVTRVYEVGIIRWGKSANRR